MGKPKIIAVIANRGGVGKSTTAAALITNLSMSPMRNNYILGVSIDSQGDLNDMLCAKVPDNYPTVREQLLTPGTALHGYRIDPHYPAYCVPADQGIELVPRDLTAVGINFQHRFAESFNKISSSDYDYVVIDSHPTQNEFTAAAVTVADHIVIVANPVTLDIKQICRSIEFANTAAARQGKPSKVLGILYTMDQNYKLNREVKDYIESIFPGLPFKTSISRTIKVQEAFGRSLYKPFSTNKAVKEYEAFTEEVMERIKNKDNE